MDCGFTCCELMHVHPRASLTVNTIIQDTLDEHMFYRLLCPLRAALSQGVRPTERQPQGQNMGKFGTLSEDGGNLRETTLMPVEFSG